MLVIEVHTDLASEIESAFAEWHAFLPPLEWQDVSLLERLVAEVGPVRFNVDPRFVVFLTERAVAFVEIGEPEG